MDTPLRLRSPGQHAEETLEQGDHVDGFRLYQKHRLRRQDRL